MAESKMDRSMDRSTDDSFPAKGSLSVGLDVEKSATGFLDEFKDQQSESNIPLSPQWLYAKPTETKDGRQQGIFEAPQENKRERRRTNNTNITPDSRWREEERETGLLGRRTVSDRSNSKKDSANSNPNPNPNPSGNTSSTKWSSRWGPDDRSDNKKAVPADVSMEKEHHHHELNPNTNPNFALRPLSEADSRDKWRPRHRQESANPNPSRGAPGFGSGGTGQQSQTTRQEPVANVGFAPGRGRAASSVYGRGRGDVGKLGFRYPRGKLLDIYRKRGPIGMNDENAPGFRRAEGLTLPNPVPPLAFVAPADEEEVTLEEIYKGKVTGDDAIGPNQTPVKITQTDSGLLAMGEEKYALPASLSVENSPAVVDAKSAAALPNDLIDDPFSEMTEKPLKQSMLSKMNLESVDLGPAFNAASMNLPDDSTSLFASSFIGDEALEELEPNPNPNSIPLEEMSFFYRDPQGGVQGPFLGIDIMSWFDEGYFGLDLPICPCDANEGTPYRPLADVMPHLRKNSQPVPVPVVQPSDAELAQLGHGGSGGSFDYGASKMVNNDGMMIEGNLEAGGSMNSKFDDQWIQNVDSEEIIYAGRPRSGMGKPQQVTNQSNEMTDLPPWASNPVSELGDSSNLGHELPPGQREANTNSNNPNDNITPLGLLWSELESPHSKHPLSSNLPSNYRKNQPDLNLNHPMKQQQQEISHFALEEQLLNEQLQRQQMQQIQQEQMFMRAGRGLGPQQASELEQLLKLQYEIEQQRQMQIKQQQLKQQQQQQEQQRREQMLRQQKMQEQIMLEQILREQQLQEQQILREQQFLKELQMAQAQQLHRQQQDAAIEQLIQAKFGPAGQRQMINPTIEQQILLGLQQRDPVQAQQLAIALRQQQQQQEQQRLEEEMLLRGVRGGPGLHRTNSSRVSQLERSLSLHDQLQSMERSLSLNVNPAMQSPRNEFAQTLAQLQGLELQERERQLQERQLQERQLQERQLQERQQRAALFGTGPMDRFWENSNANNPNSQLERSLMESQLNHQMQLEVENQRRIETQQRRGIPKPGLTLEDPHPLNEMMYQNMPLQSPSFKDPSMLFPRRNPSPGLNNPNPNSGAGVNIEGMQTGFVRPGSGSGSRSGSFVEKQFYGNFNEFQNEEGGNVNLNDGSFFENLNEFQNQEMIRAPTPPARIGSTDDVMFKYEMGDDSVANAFNEEMIDTRQHNISRVDSRSGASQKQIEPDQQMNNAPRPPSRPTSADAKQDLRTGSHASETQSTRKDAPKLMRNPSSSNTESDASGRLFIDMLKSTKKPPQPAPQQTDDSSEASKGAKKGKKKGRQIDPALLGFKVHSNRIMMGEIQRPDES